MCFQARPFCWLHSPRPPAELGPSGELNQPCDVRDCSHRCRCLAEIAYEAINDPETPSDSISLNRPFELLPLVNKFTGAWGPPHDLYQHQGKHYIILFPGYFNPPHVGHMELLKAAFKRCWALNLVGAIIAPAEDDDTQLRSACDGQATFVLPASQRAELWRQSRVPPDRVWVFDGAPQRLRRIKGRMGEIAWRRDLDIEFILLRGPESLREIPQLTDWGCATAITSDVSQPASYRLPYSLLPLDGCGPWGVAVRGLFGLVVVEEEVSQGLSSGASEPSLDDVSECRHEFQGYSFMFLARP